MAWYFVKHRDNFNNANTPADSWTKRLALVHTGVAMVAEVSNFSYDTKILQSRKFSASDRRNMKMCFEHEIALLLWFLFSLY
jgi:hypothetical protein